MYLSILDGLPVILGGLALGAVGFALRWMFSTPDPAQAFSDLPLTPIAESEDYRLVKVRGRIRAPGPLLQSPLSGVQCLGYRIEIQEQWEGARGWNTRDELSHEAASDFLIDDGTACALVLTKGARLLLDNHPVDESQHGEAIDGLLAGAGRKRDNSPTTRYRCRESLLIEGRSVVVRATARWIDRPASLREPPGRTLELRGTTEFPVLVGDARDVDG